MLPDLALPSHPLYVILPPPIGDGGQRRRREAAGIYWGTGCLGGFFGFSNFVPLHPPSHVSM